MPRPHQNPPRRAVAPGRIGPAETVPEAQDPSAPARRRPPWSASPGASSSPRRGAFVPRAGALVPANFAVAISSALFSLTRRGTEALSSVVRQPVGVVLDQPAIRLVLDALDVHQRELDGTSRLLAHADQPVALFDIVVIEIVKAGDGQTNELVRVSANLLPGFRSKREGQVSQQVAVVGELVLPVHFRQEIVVGQSKRCPDAVVLVIHRQRRRLDLGWLLDWDRRSVVQFEVFLTQAHGLEIQPVPLTSPSVDRVDTGQSSIVQLEHTVDLTLMLDDLGDGPRPAAQGHIREVRVAYARLDPNLVPDLKARGA